jgi:hypothetical protein
VGLTQLICRELLLLDPRARRQHLMPQHLYPRLLPRTPAPRIILPLHLRRCRNPRARRRDQTTTETANPIREEQTVRNVPLSAPQGNDLFRVPGRIVFRCESDSGVSLFCSPTWILGTGKDRRHLHKGDVSPKQGQSWCRSMANEQRSHVAASRCLIRGQHKLSRAVP